MSPGQDETRVCGYVRSEYIHWALWRTLIRTKYFFALSPQAFWLSSEPGVLSTLVTSVVFYLLTRAPLMRPGQDEMRVCEYVRSEFIHSALWRTLIRTKYFFVCPPQAFWLSSEPSVLSTLVTSVVLYLLTRATFMSPGQDETRVCRYVSSEFIHWALWRTLMRTKYFLLVHHKHFI